ncbi:flagellar biosynthesis anti-sigma factor FlgM [Campylobacter sp.]|uniref:flagellar biosynthesis anti-sigma factor FlgM n=1 Tax=Campylobacter sp. TaxID=205 RepID=UPI0026DDA8A0|nr:flagellar biosynthesis anti-sigma factor FlgM [Campylobacter sp.]MDO4674191.1 flagellar biosynthesis anti-sigma factor FlgM [Campylobacter sp.]
MINPIQQNYIANASNVHKTDKETKETKTNEAQKTESSKASKIAEQIKNGTYELNLKATADAIADSLL